LTADVLTLGPISAETAPKGAFTDTAAVVGRVAATGMFAGQPVMDTLLAPTGVGAGLQALVPRGMRAITVEVNETSGVAGMLVPGARVDVVCTLSGGSKQDTVAVTIVQDVLVQAVGQRLMPGRNPDEKEPAPVRSVTLIATPRDAEAIDLATSTGRTRLVLRGSNDRTLTETAGVTFIELRGEDPDAPDVEVRQPVETVRAPVQTPVASTQPVADPFEEPATTRRTVTLIKGGVRTQVVFEQPKAGEPKTGEVVTSTNEGGGK
jgi:pilus assembly protein CpaB